MPIESHTIMRTNVICDFCGRCRESGESPHPNHDSCPFEKNHKSENETLLESIQFTSARNSVCLFGWNRSYPAFKTVFKTRTWLDTFDTSTESYEGHEKYETSYFKKTIWATSNPHQVDSKYYRIEYDPTTESLIEWYSITDETETEGTGSFEAYLRKDDPDVSFFGSTLPG